MHTALVLGAGGFIGSHLARRLKSEGYFVRGVDLKLPEFSTTAADEFVLGDLREQSLCREVVDRHFDEVYQLAADMGGAGYIFTGEHDADVMHNSATINLHIIEECSRRGIKDVFYSSSACMYPAHNQEDPDNPNCAEDSAYPANPDSEYGWEKLFSERLYLAYNRNRGMRCRVARFHNIFGPEGTWRGGREKAPAAICRKVAEAELTGRHEIEIWGDGKQTRSFMYIDDCVFGTEAIMDSELAEPVNLGSATLVTIDELVTIVEGIAGITLERRYNPEAPTGVRGRNSDNTMLKNAIGWEPATELRDGLEVTYRWVRDQVRAGRPVAIT
jgi:GDP-D-mannose 3', 5'-epimerase